MREKKVIEKEYDVVVVCKYVGKRRHNAKRRADYKIKANFNCR